MILKKLTIVLLFGVFWFECPTCEAQIREVQRSFMMDVAYTQNDRQGNPMVVVNPRMCRRMGPDLCNFFRAHEYAHINLGHLNSNISRQQAEAEADCLAARTCSPASVNAAIRYFRSGRGGSRFHGSSEERARRVERCAQQF